MLWNYILLSGVCKRLAEALEAGPKDRMGGRLVQESGWLEEPEGKQGLFEGLPVRQSCSDTAGKSSNKLGIEV